MGALGGPAIALSELDAKRAVDSYRKSHPEVVRLCRYGDKVLDSLFAGNEDFAWGPMQVRGQRIYLPNGAWIDYSHLTRDGDGYAITTRYGAGRIYGAKLVENVVQALSRVLLSQAILKLSAAALPGCKIVLTCHDEVVYTAPEEKAQLYLDIGLQIMKTPPAWCPDLPLDAEGSHDIRYSK